MNFDDESQLSAFLDEELDPGDRMAVAWEVESSTATAQRLADLQSSRDLIRGLNRPAIPVDLSAAVLAAIVAAQPPAQARRAKSGVRRFAAAFVGVASMAASLMVAMILLHRSTHHDDAHPLFSFGLSRADHSSPSRTFEPIVANSPPTDPAARPTPSPLSISVAPSPAAPQSVESAKVFVAEAPVVDGPEPARPGQVDTMLGHRKVFRALIVTDVLDQASKEVRSIIERDALREPEFGRITLAQGIVIDPDRPGEAEVYTVVMDEPSIRPFVDQLRAKFPAVELQAETEPTLVTQLTEVGQVAVFADVRPARLGLPPQEFAPLVAAKATRGTDPIRTTGPAAVPLDPTEPVGYGFPPDPLLSDQTGGEVDRRSIETNRARSLATGKPMLTMKSRMSNEPVTVLVWVARSTRP